MAIAKEDIWEGQGILWAEAPNPRQDVSSCRAIAIAPCVMSLFRQTPVQKNASPAGNVPLRGATYNDYKPAARASALADGNGRNFGGCSCSND